MSQENEASSADKYPEPKREGQQVAHNWRQTFRDTFQALHRESWIQNIVIGAIFLLLGPGVGLLMKNEKVIVVGFAAGVTLLIWFIAFAVLRQLKNQPSQAFLARYTWTSNYEKPTYWFVQGGQVISIRTPMFVQFTNLRPRPVMILSYWIEQQTKDGKWERVGLPYGADGTFYFGEHRSDVAELKYTTFDSAVQNRNIAPNETVIGWIFLTKEWNGQLRLGMKDTLDQVSVEPLLGTSAEGWTTQPQLMEPAHRKADISGLPLVVEDPANVTK